MTKFICQLCNFRFESESPKIGRKCPYCGKEGIIAQSSAEELLDEE